MLTNGKWFSLSKRTLVGSDPNTRFAERLDNVWFKFTTTRGKVGGTVTDVARLGKFLTDVLNKVNALIERVEKLEKREEPQPEPETLLDFPHPTTYRSSMGRTATGSGLLAAKETVAGQTVLSLIEKVKSGKKFLLIEDRRAGAERRVSYTYEYRGVVPSTPMRRSGGDRRGGTQ